MESGRSKKNSRTARRTSQEPAGATTRSSEPAVIKGVDGNYRDILDSVSDGVYKIDCRGYFTYLNHVSLCRSGLSPDNYRNCHFLDTILPEDRERARANFDRVMRGEENPPYELRLRGTDGRTYFREVKSKPIFENGRVVELLGISRDVTDRKQAEELIQNANAVLERMVEERTRELARKTQSLEEEIARRKIVTDTLREKEEELSARGRSLEEMNTTLSVLLSKMEQEKKETWDAIILNFQKTVLPYLEALKKSSLSKAQRAFVESIEASLTNIASPFMKNLRDAHPNLSPHEAQIAIMIREGRTTKEIAETLGVSLKTIEFHRSRMRRKLGLKSRKTPLHARLLHLT